MFQKYYGITLAEGAYVENMRFENIDDLDGIPDNIDSKGRIWFNNKKQKLQFTFTEMVGGVPVLNVATLNTNVGGWKDLLGSFATAKTGTSAAPVWADMGNSFYAWRFDNAKDTGLQIQFHTTHDIDYTKKAMLHIHWCPTTTSVGVVRFKVDYIIQKGHGQGGNMMAPITGTFTLDATTKGVIGEHMVTEQLPANGLNLLEPDCLVIMNISRLGTHAIDTYTGSIYGFTADLHYYSNGGTTLGNKPNFNTEVLPVSI